jgi:hypothetical protein
MLSELEPPGERFSWCAIFSISFQMNWRISFFSIYHLQFKLICWGEQSARTRGIHPLVRHEIPATDHPVSDAYLILIVLMLGRWCMSVGTLLYYICSAYLYYRHGKDRRLKRLKWGTFNRRAKFLIVYKIYLTSPVCGNNRNSLAKVFGRF